MASSASSSFGFALGRPHSLTLLLDKSFKALSMVICSGFVFLGTGTMERRCLTEKPAFPSFIITGCPSFGCLPNVTG
uniref:Uncharacterized protein MANES_03G000500 n=1 Tax=Rhizophora mucronata TaxID=61149 RepID=A0A2P2MBT2_RHIMU